MSADDEAKRLAEEKAREAAEAAVISNRISELHEEPVRGNFDADHLKAIHTYIFNGYPEHQPGVVRGDTTGWVKTRELEGGNEHHVVHYEHQDIEEKITGILDQFGGAETIKGLTPDAAAGRLAQLYGDLDHAHGFYEGNSRTLREFTRELAKEAGFELDWTGTAVGTEKRNELYRARDLAVLERAFPDLTMEKVMETDNRSDYEASFGALSAIEKLRNNVGDRSLEAIIRDGLTPENSLERAYSPSDDRALDGEILSPVSVAASIEEPALAVFDAVTGMVESLVDFVCDFLAGGGSKPPPSRAQLSQMDEIRAERRARAAAESIADSIERGEGLKAEDIQNLTPTHLENIKLRGDAYVLEMVERIERDRERDKDRGRER